MAQDPEGSVRMRAPVSARERDNDMELLLRAVVDNAPFGAHMYKLVPDDRLVLIGYNERAERMLGIEHASLIGLTLEEAFPGNVGTETPEAYRSVAREGTTWDTDEYAYDAEGICGVFEVHAFSFGPERVCVFFRDVTESRALKLALEDSEVRYSELFANMLEGCALCKMIFDQDGQPSDWVYLGVNDAFGRLTGLYDVVGKRVLEILPTIKDDSPELFEAYGRVVTTGEPEELEFDFKTLDMWLHISVFSPKRGHFAAVFEDITERKRAEAALREGNIRLERMVRDVAEAMGKVVEARDPYTQGHEQRVAELSKAIAIELELSPDEVYCIEMAALVHDIGKLGVPSEILSKPGRLSELEFDLIKEHAQHSHDILQNISFPWPVAEIVLQHHERMDGSGYPNGLRDGEILLASRILAVADVLEAMASHRPYRPALGVDAAMAEFVAQPQRYDADVVEACARLHHAGRLGI